MNTAEERQVADAVWNLQETWKPIPDYEAAYEISNVGRIRGLDRYVRDKNGVRKFIHGKMLKPFPSVRDGRLCVKLTGQKSQYISRLVLLAFVGPPPTGTECCHKNGNNTDNRVGNLYWGTQSENTYDRVRHGTHAMSNRVTCPIGHRLVMPNLIAAAIADGRRGCLACNRASAFRVYARKRGYPFDFKATADARYIKIMNGGVPIA